MKYECIFLMWRQLWYFQVYASVYFMLFSNAQIVSKSCAVFWQYYILCSWRADLHLFNVVYDFYKLLDLRASGA